MLDRVCRKIKGYYRYYHNKARRKFYNIISVDPCYQIRDKLQSSSIVVDFGVGDNADFSMFLIKKYNSQCYGFDPTKKHFNSLKKLETETSGKFKFYPFALAEKKEKKIFYESKENISGSFYSGHINVKHDHINKYYVDSITINEVFKLLAIDRIDLLKMDIEGAEYKVIAALDKNIVDKIEQIIIEFHHHCIDRFTKDDTLKGVNKLKSYNFKEYTEDGVNYLFFKL